MKKTKTIFRFTAIIALLLSTLNLYSQDKKVDPNHLSTGGYGYLISNDKTCSVWWAEGAYKVMREAPIPQNQNKKINIKAAKNEWESFMVIVNPKIRIDNFNINVTDFISSNGSTIPSTDIKIRKVEYVNVTHPTDRYGFEGKWPDPLPLYTQPETLYAWENQPFWITVKVPKNATAGEYKGTVRMFSGGWGQEISVSLNVWDFELPDSPSMRSGFGMSIENISKYDNLHTDEQQQEAHENYMKSFSDYKISPYDPFQFSQIKEDITGVEWMGGFFDSKEMHGGAYSYMVVDNSKTENTEATHRELIPVTSDVPYTLKWWSKSKEETQNFVVGIECYDAGGKHIIYENRFEQFAAKNIWNSYSFPLGSFTSKTKYIKLKLYPSNRTIAGEDTGTTWFDDLALTRGKSEENQFVEGNFEVDLNKINIKLDFKDFNLAAKKYFDDYGFNSYRIRLKGLGGGSYYSREGGVFEGFAQGTDEYNKLMKEYLIQIQDNLAKNGMLGKEYIYWFDEPNESDYPFIHETNAMIKQYAPKLTTFLTEHIAGQDISDVTDISCTIWHKLNHEKIKKMNDKGLQHWSYLCCWPKSPWISEFIDHDAVNMRMWMWASYVYGLNGILIWETTYWNSVEASPAGYLQNPWDEAMSWVNGYGWIYGKQTIWGNGDGRLYYPLNRDPNNDKSTHLGEPVPSVRLETIRDGIEDYEYLVILEKLIEKAPKKRAAEAAEAKKLLEIPKSIFADEQTYSKNPQDILEYRKKVAEAIVKLSNAQ